MNKINIYQTSNRDYVFMNYDFALTHNFNLYDYKLVASFETEKEDLETIFIMGNNGELQKHFNLRSLSVSDIIEINGKKYYIDSFGYQEIKENITL